MVYSQLVPKTSLTLALNLILTLTLALILNLTLNPNKLTKERVDVMI